MAVSQFSAELFNHIYNKSGYFASYSMEDTTTRVIEKLYGGQYSGFSKSIIPSILVADNYGAAPIVGNNISSASSLNGYCFSQKIITYNTKNDIDNDVYIVIFRTENFYYVGYVYSTLTDGTILYYTSFISGSSWNNCWTRLEDYIYIFLLNTGSSLLSQYTPLANYTFELTDGGTLTTAQAASYFGNPLSNYGVLPITGDLPEEIDPKDNTDPYFNGGLSTTGGGDGTFNIESDPIDFPQLPSISAVSTGFLTIYNPSLQQVQDLADYMWNTPFDINNLKKLFADPMDCIIGFSMLPLTIPNTGSQSITIGNIVSTVSANVASSQFVILDCGSININEYWGSYLDYSPYTKIDLYLPFVGSVQINPDEVMNKTIQIKYYIDILDGGFVCFVKAGDSVLYNYSGSCASMIPITGNNWNELYGNILNVIGTLSIGAAAGAVAAGAEAASASAEGSGIVDGLLSNTYIGTTPGTGAATVSAVMGSKPAIQKSNVGSGAVGLLGIKKPYLTITIPRQCLPKDQNKISGYPSYITKKIGDLSGFTVIQNLKLTGISGTLQEINEIINVLTKGVIL